jgi:hypothetical protein
MKGWFPTLVLIAALVTAFALSWRTRPAPEEQITEVPERLTPLVEPAKKAPPVPLPPTFGEYPCASNDCADDKAGYRWAENNAITDADSCTGTTEGFIEGCRVYARQHDAKLD